MVASIFHKGKSLRVDFYHPIDISMPLDTTEERTKAWYVSPVKIEPVKTEGWIGDVNSGGSVNFRNIFFNPHGNGTHTECVGHISKENYSINQCLKQFMFLAELITILPEELENGDKIISRNRCACSTSSFLELSRASCFKQNNYRTDIRSKRCV